MACFVVPAVEAIVTTAIGKVIKDKEQTMSAKETAVGEVHIPMSEKISWLNKMLWGGSALLAFEHLWHGEITPFFPFLTAMENANDAMEMLHEMSTVGVTMAVVVTAVWAGMCLFSRSFTRKGVAEDK